MARPSLLTDELTLKIRQLALEGISYVQIHETLDIAPETWDTWVYTDYQGFRAMLNECKRERLLKKAEKVSDDIISVSHTNEQGRIDSKLLAIKQKESEFIRETLGKKEYSKRSELTGKDGDKLIPESNDGEIKDLAQKLNALYTRRSITSDGVNTNSVDTKVSD